MNKIAHNSFTGSKLWTIEDEVKIHNDLFEPVDLYHGNTYIGTLENETAVDNLLAQLKQRDECGLLTEYQYSITDKYGFSYPYVNGRFENYNYSMSHEGLDYLLDIHLDAFYQSME